MPIGRRATTLLNAGLPQLSPDYLIERATWSATITYVVFAGIATLIALPMQRSIGAVSAEAGGTSGFFAALFCLLFGVLAITLGQAEPRWRGRLSWGAQFRQLSLRVGFALALALPFWSVYMMANVQSLAALGLMLIYLWLWGLMLGLAGWRLALTPWSEVVRFNVKYVSFFGYLLLSGLGQLIPFVGVIGPFRPFDGLIAEGPGAWGLLVQGAVVWIGVSLALVVSLRRVYDGS